MTTPGLACVDQITDCIYYDKINNNMNSIQSDTLGGPGMMSRCDGKETSV